MKKYGIFHLAFVLFGCWTLAVSAADKEVKILKVLMIGNSFSKSVFSHFPAIAQASGKELLLDGAMLPGCSLERHVKEFDKSEADPAYKPYSWRQKNGKKNLKEKLTEQKWDVVTIQQASPLSWRGASYHPWIDRLVAIIRQYAPQAEIVLQQTWAYRVDSVELQRWKIDQAEMFRRIAENYDKETKNFGFRLIPVGYAVQLARETQKVKYVPPAETELEKLQRPELPKQEGSLIRGHFWKWSKKAQKYVIIVDALHLNQRGEYLQACVWYLALFGDAISDRYQPDGLTPEDAAFMRETARKAVAAYAAPRAAAK